MENDSTGDWRGIEQLAAAIAETAASSTLVAAL